jgi:hypothetical protein
MGRPAQSEAARFSSYRLSRLACEAIRCRLRLPIDSDETNLIYPAGAWLNSGAEGKGEVRIFGVDSGHSHAAVLGTLLGRAFDQQLAKPLT